MSLIKFPMRSLLFVPGNNINFINKSFDSDADVLVFDVEDSVQSKSNKKNARELLRKELKSIKNKKIFVRINDIESGEILYDLSELMLECVDGFMFPKVKNRYDVYFIDKLLTAHEINNNFTIGKFKLILIIETSSAIINLRDICSISDRVISIAFGSEDYLTDISGINDSDGSVLFFPRALIVNSARANNLTPIDTVQLNVHDLDELEKKLKVSKNLGFEGMLVLHPKQLELAHKYYSPSTNEIKRAKNIIKLSKKINEQGKGVAIIDGEFVGPPMIKSALKILEKAKLFKK